MAGKRKAEREERVMLKLSTFGTALVAVLIACPAHADDNTVTIGMILPMTGQQASTGKQERAGAELYMRQHGDTVAGKKIVLEVKDDTGAADVTKRLAEELIGNDHAKVLMGFGLTPLALLRRRWPRKRRFPRSSAPPRRP